MFYLLLSILSATSLFIIFKLFEKFGIDNSQAIVVNYLSAAVLGFLFIPAGQISEIAHQNWLFLAFVIGTLFLFLFRLMAVTSQKMGIATATVANKMGVVIPVCAAVYLYDDTITFLKTIGVVLALAGVYLCSQKDNKIKIEKKYLLLPIVLFLGSGVSDTLIKYTEHFYLNERSTGLFIPCVFGFSASAGIIDLIRMNKIKITKKNLLWGLILGIPNYGSIYFLMKTISVKEVQSSVIFPVNNVGIVVVSALAAFALFRENLTKENWVGIGISVFAIILIAVSA